MPSETLFLLRNSWYGIARENVFFLGRYPNQAIMRANSVYPAPPKKVKVQILVYIK